MYITASGTGYYSNGGVIITESVFILFEQTYDNPVFIGVYKTKEIALVFAEKYGLEEDDIEEFQINDIPNMNEMKDKKSYFVYVEKEGIKLIEINKPSTRHLCQEHYFNSINNVVGLGVYCWAKDENEAAEIAYAVRKKLIANGKWDQYEKKIKS